jgi:hypothetical protein
MDQVGRGQAARPICRTGVVLVYIAHRGAELAPLRLRLSQHPGALCAPRQRMKAEDSADRLESAEREERAEERVVR